MLALRELFKRRGVLFPDSKIRKSMGLAKQEHIRALLADAPSAGSIEDLYAEFLPLQTQLIRQCSDVIEGVPALMQKLRARGIQIGSTTGYTRELLDELRTSAKEHGFDPESTICSDEVPAGRPAPWMALCSAMQLGVFPAETCVKVGDTVADIEEGRNAGMWTVAVTETGNEMGLTPEELAGLSEAERSSKARAIERTFFGAGAHCVVHRAADLLPVIDEIGLRMNRGERP